MCIINFLEQNKNIIEVIITIVTSIFAVVTIIIIYKTLSEIKKQRENTHRPDLYIKGINLYIHFKIPFTPFIVSDKKTIDIEQYDINYFPIVKLKLYNIDFGTAKELKIKWIYDLKKIVANVNNLFENYEPVILTNEKIKLIFKTKQFEYEFEIKERVNSFNFVLPYNLNNEIFYINFPPILLYIVGVYCSLICLKIDKNEVFEDFFKFENIKLFMQYKDIESKIYKKNIFITVNTQYIKDITMADKRIFILVIGIREDYKDKTPQLFTKLSSTRRPLYINTNKSTKL